MPRVLIVDDAATVRLYHRRVVEGMGLAADEAINGVEALEKALVEPYDLYLVDVNMPKLDGYGFLRALRGEAIDQAPAVMISTEAATHDAERAYDAGANAYLVKPVAPTQLQRLIRLLVPVVSA